MEPSGAVRHPSGAPTESSDHGRIAPRLGAEAAALGELGAPVHPLRAGEKRPATQRGLHDATTDPAQIDAWWRRWPEANVGIRTGIAGRVVLDVDPPHGEDTLHELERSYSPLPETPRAKTARGGTHYYFRAPRPVPCSAGKVGPGLDIRGDGGYVVAPPSVVSGRPYAWDVAPGELPIAPMPPWLLELAAPTSDDKRTPTPSSEWAQLGRGVGEGARNAAACRVFGHLLARRVDPVLARELLIGWNVRNRPPLSAEEIEHVCESIAGREMRKRERDSGRG